MNDPFGSIYTDAYMCIYKSYYINSCIHVYILYAYASMHTNAYMHIYNIIIVVVVIIIIYIIDIIIIIIQPRWGWERF